VLSECGLPEFSDHGLVQGEVILCPHATFCELLCAKHFACSIPVLGVKGFT